MITAAGTLFTIPCEAIFNQHPRIYRSALVGVGPARPTAARDHRRAMARDSAPSREADRETTDRRTAELGQQHAAHQDRSTTSCSIDALPVDIRHNAKIFREKLAVWAARSRS